MNILERGIVYFFLKKYSYLPLSIHKYFTFRYIARNYAAVNAGIFQRFGLVMSQAEFGTLQNACADVLFQLFNSALVNSFSTLRTAASKYNNSITLITYNNNFMCKWMCSVNNGEAIILVKTFLSQQMISRLKKFHSSSCFLWICHRCCVALGCKLIV